MSDSTINPSDINSEELLQLLRRKAGSWVEWGHACQQLQKAGYSSQVIFEASGFEPIQQNQIIVAAQVYDSILEVGVPDAVQKHYGRIGSDSLYELRILTKNDRALAAEYLFNRNIDSEGSKEVAKAFKEFAYFRNLPNGFIHHPGDAVAYQYWRYAKQQSDLADRSRLMARGLMFAHSQSARQQLEQLLAEYTTKSIKTAPNLPLYRLESDEELPLMIPLLGKLPLSSEVLVDLPQITPQGSFGVVNSDRSGSWITLPGWTILRKSLSPYALLINSTNLPKQLTGKEEETLLVIDRGQTTWDEYYYFMVDRDGQLSLEWFGEEPTLPLLGKLILIMRPKNMIEAEETGDIWEIEGE